MRRLHLRVKHRLRRPVLILSAMLLVVGGSLTSAMLAQAADLTSGLVLWYKLGGGAGTTVADASGNNRAATVEGTAGWSGDEGLTFNGTDTYLKLPDNVMRGLDSISVSMEVYVDPAQEGAYWFYGLGNTDAGGAGKGYLLTTGDSFRTAITLDNWCCEQNTAANRKLDRGVWKQVVYTQTGSTGVLYEDGQEAARNTGVTVKPSAIGGGTTIGYVGRSLYNADKLFKGKMRDFRVYDRALERDEVEQLGLPYSDARVAKDKEALTLGDTSDVTGDLSLPKTAPHGSAVTWASDDESVVALDGKVTRPAQGRPDAHVTLTATITSGASRATKTFKVVVRAEFDDSTKVNRARDALVVHNVGDVRGNLTLPTKGEFGTTVTWQSDRPTVIKPDGVVQRPAYGQSAVTVVLHAKVRLNQAEATRTFTAKVPPLPDPEALKNKKGYLLSYFTGEGNADGEQVYFALSRGNDPLKYQELNDGKPVLTSSLGDKGVRDPFVIRSPEGDKFYQIATDLKIHGNGNWDYIQRHGSKSIMVWESTDLVNWTNQRLVKVAPDTPEQNAGNTWAPEMIYDETSGNYVVFWASKVYDERTDPDHKGGTHNKMWYATTRDFHTFSEPKVWSDPGHSVIDSTMIKHGDRYYRFTKDEKGGVGCANGKYIFAEWSESVIGEYNSIKRCIGANGLAPGQSGEGPLVFKSNTDAKWYLFIDEYGGRGYIPFETTDLSTGEWTPSKNYALPGSGNRKPRHGTVLPVTKTEYDRLLKAYGGAGEADGSADLLVHYPFDETGGTVARDASGQGNDGKYERTPAFGTGVSGGSVKLAGGAKGSTTAPYVTIPKGVLRNMQSTTVSAFVKWDAAEQNQWIFALGPDDKKYLFATPRNEHGKVKAAISADTWRGEAQVFAGSALPRGKWRHVTVVVDGAAGKIRLYVDGLLAEEKATALKAASVYDATKDFSGYIGKSLYGSDPYFRGELDDFRIYGRALSAKEVFKLGGDTTAVTKASVPQLKIGNGGEQVPAVVDQELGRIVLPVAPGTDLTKLAPTFELAPDATVSPASGTVQDLSKPVGYTVTGADGKQRTWSVEAKVMRSPILPGLNADPNISVFDNKFWLHVTNDGFQGWSGSQFYAYSSTDLVNWTKSDVILDVGADISWADNSAWAPGFARKDGKYYFYFSAGKATGDTRKHLGVAVADSPGGPFEDALGEPMIKAGTFSGQMIDPAVFTDDDGKSYLYWGNGHAYQVQLNDDMVSFDKAKVQEVKIGEYREGSFVFKRKGVYYLTWSEDDTGSENYRVAYATGSSPLGPWKHKGVILSKDLSLGIKGPGHHSVVQVPGTDDWYIAYHRFAMPNGNGYNRETTIDRLEFEADGSIRKVVPTLESIQPLDTADAGPDVSGAQGTAITLRGRVTEGSKAAWTYAPAAGVDAGATCAFADAAAADTTVTCTDDGTYTVTLTGGKATDTATVTVTNANPAIGALTLPKSAKTGETVTLTVELSDRGGNDIHTCKVTWQDGSTSEATAAKGGGCTLTHVYTKAGSYRPRVTVTDDDGGTATKAVKAALKVTGPTVEPTPTPAPVTPPGGGTGAGTGGWLPTTGFKTGLFAGLGVLLVGGGVALYLIGRSRRITGVAGEDL